MAKWGEGDPRWIVEERPDATNVNNWHWTEKNADAWSKKKITDLFAGLKVKDPSIGECEVAEVTKCEGEARVNNRKAKLIFFYEWELSLKWKSGEVEGAIDIPNFSEEHVDLKDVDISVKAEKPSALADKWKESFRAGYGAGIVRDRMREYVDALKHQFSVGLILPNKGDNTPKALNDAMKPLKLNATPPESKHKEENVSFSSINMEETFKCTGEELYNVLTQKTLVKAFMCSDVTMEEVAKTGSKFAYLGGNIQGSFTELVPFTSVRQKWRLSSWPKGVYSEVKISIAQSKDNTKLVLSQTGVPAKELDKTKSGWKKYYWEAIKRCFGFGQILF